MRSVYLALSFAFAAVLIPGCADEPADEPPEGAGTSQSDASENPLPDAAGISTMKVRLKQPAPAIQEFEVPRNHWENILQSLTPARVDPHAAKWESFGDLEITTTLGFLMVVQLFGTDSDPGAFAVEMDGRSRTYYRGGSTQVMVDSIREAYSELGQPTSGR